MTATPYRLSQPEGVAAFIADFRQAWQQGTQLDADTFTKGSCHDFAAALSRTLRKAGVMPELLVAHQLALEQDGTAYLGETFYVHTVVRVAGETFDIHGPGAVERWNAWAIQHDNLPACGEVQLPRLHRGEEPRGPLTMGFGWVPVQATQSALTRLIDRTDPEVVLDERTLGLVSATLAHLKAHPGQLSEAAAALRQDWNAPQPFFGLKEYGQPGPHRAEDGTWYQEVVGVTAAMKKALAKGVLMTEGEPVRVSARTKAGCLALMQAAHRQLEHSAGLAAPLSVEQALTRSRSELRQGAALSRA